MADPHRLRALSRDLDLLSSGWTPDARTLSGAPSLEGWTLRRDRDNAWVLEGVASGHPDLPGTGRPIVTSPVAALDMDAGWARTVSRWFRLGEPSLLMRAALARRAARAEQHEDEPGPPPP